MLSSLASHIYFLQKNINSSNGIFPPTSFYWYWGDLKLGLHGRSYKLFRPDCQEHTFSVAFSRHSPPGPGDTYEGCYSLLAASRTNLCRNFHRGPNSFSTVCSVSAFLSRMALFPLKLGLELSLSANFPKTAFPHILLES